MLFRSETFTQHQCSQSQLKSTKSSKCFSEMKNHCHATVLTSTNHRDGPWPWKGFQAGIMSCTTNGEKTLKSKILRKMKRSLFTGSCQTIKTKVQFFFYDHSKRIPYSWELRHKETIFGYMNPWNTVYSKVYISCLSFSFPIWC